MAKKARGIERVLEAITHFIDHWSFRHLIEIGLGHKLEDDQVDLFVVASLAFLLALMVLAGAGTPGAIVAGTFSFLVVTQLLSYLYIVVGSGLRTAESARRSLVLGFVNFVEIGVGFGNLYYLADTLHPGSFSSGFGSAGDAVIASLMEQIGRGGAEPSDWWTRLLVLAHGGAWLIVLVVVLGGFVNLLANNPTNSDHR